MMPRSKVHPFLVVLAFSSLATVTAHGWVQINLTSLFNADTVIRYSGGNFTTPSALWDVSGNWMITQSAANQLAIQNSGTNPIGVNDNGFYPASGVRAFMTCNCFHQRHAQWRSGNIATTPGTFSFNVPVANYSQFAIFGASGNGFPPLVITLTYSTGVPTVINGVTLPDWFNGNPGNTAASPAGSQFALTPAMSRSGSFQAYQPPANGAYIYGINLAPDVTRQLTNVSVAYTPRAVLNLLAGRRAPIPATPEVSTRSWLQAIGSDSNRGADGATAGCTDRPVRHNPD